MKIKICARVAAASFVLLVAVIVAGCSTGSTTGGGTGTTPAGSSGGTTIAEQNFAFSPANATVKAGDAVTFVNNDSAPHNVKIDGKELGVQQPGESKAWTAPKDGSYPFSCIIHPSMTGQITVGAGGSGAPAPTNGTGGGSAPPAGGYGY